MDFWMGPSTTSNISGLIHPLVDCETAGSLPSATVILNPASTHPVSTVPLLDMSVPSKPRTTRYYPPIVRFICLFLARLLRCDHKMCGQLGTTRRELL